MGKVKVTQVKSAINKTKREKETLVALGLGRIGKTAEHEMTPAIQGMVRKVQHLIEVVK
ncbi:MAG: 50S ribosomal protein L30 [Weeksellaceae bacterium]